MRDVAVASGATHVDRDLAAGHDYEFRLSSPAPTGGTASTGAVAFSLREVDDEASSVKYGGRWATVRASGDQGGSARFASARGSAATLTFTGRSVAWIGPVGPARGSADVEVDGGRATTVTTRSPQDATRQVLFVRSWPDDGPHSLRIVAGGNGSIGIDSFAIVGSSRHPVAAPPPTQPQLTDTTLPVRATFYYGWYPEAWKESGGTLTSTFHPSAGDYDSSDPSVVAGQIRAMRYAGIGAAIASWWGAGTRTDGRLPQLLAASAGSGLRWAISVEPEATGNLDASAIDGVLRYIADHYARDPSYVRVGGRFVVFVPVSADDGCDVVDRWTASNAVHAYLVIGAVASATACSHQPDDWFAADPTRSDQAVGQSSYAISAGFWRFAEQPRLVRDPARWQTSVQAMVASGARFQIAGTFNQWGDGSAIESAKEWASSSGFGTYLDLLHANAAGAAPGGPSTNGDPVIVGAGAIASCGSDNDEATAQLVASIQGTVVTLGDNALPSGSATEYRDCYGPSWGVFRDRTRPTPGSRDYVTPDAAGYFGYFGQSAGDPAKGYYAYTLGSWRIYVLNSNCSKVGGCDRGSPQERWLANDLRAHPTACVGAYWQSPRFSTGQFGDDVRMQAFWQDLYASGAEFVISGHDRNYQRYAPLTPTGTIDRVAGIREFVVGTGGDGHAPLKADPTSHREAGTDSAFGVIRMTLHATGYEWQFVATPDTPYTDSGAAGCH